MNKVVKTFFIIMLALGLMGIILGIIVGLYRNDVLARMQVKPGAEDEITNWDNDLEMQESGTQTTEEKSDIIFNLLVQGNLHTTLLATGTVITIISVIMFLLNIRKNFE